jgi:hypothetical protein
MVTVSGSEPPENTEPEATTLEESEDRVMAFPVEPAVTAVRETTSEAEVAEAIPQEPTEPEFIAEAMLEAMTEASAVSPSNSSEDEGAPATAVRTTPPISSSVPARTGATATVNVAVAAARMSGVPDTVMEVVALVEGEEGPVLSVDGSSQRMSASEEWNADIAVGLAGGQGKDPEVGSQPVLIIAPLYYT